MLLSRAIAIGCGARTGTLDLEPMRDDDAGRPIDAGPDAGVPDAGRDAGVFEPCTLEVVVPARTIFDYEPPGSFDAPHVVSRSGALDLAATYASDDLRWEGSRVDRFTSSLEHIEAIGFVRYPASALHVAVRGPEIGLCSFDRGWGELMFQVYRASDREEWFRQLGQADCEDAAANGDRWLIAYKTREGALRYQGFDARGETTAEGALRPDAPEAIASRSTITAFGGGFAWAVTPDAMRRLTVGVLEGSEPIFHTIDDVHPAFAAPAIAVWPFRDRALAIANHSVDGARLHVVDADSGEELLRSEPFGLSMAGDVTPAVLATPRGVIVAMLNYGDADPFAGRLEMAVLDPSGRNLGGIVSRTRRWSLTRGGIALAADGDRIVVHWTEMDPAPVSVERHVTRAMILRCL